MKGGQLIAVNGDLYTYDGIEQTLGMALHKVYEIDMDDDGYLMPTDETVYFTDEELKNSDVDFTPKQWHGIVESVIRYNYDLTDMQISGAAMDIVDRCFAYGIPKVHELEDYIAEYLNR